MKIRMIQFLAAACFLASCQVDNDPDLGEVPPLGPVPATKIKDVSTEAAVRLIKDKQDLVILDVRTPQEFADGHLENAQLIDFNSPDFSEKIQQLDPTKPYLVHCASGGRSSRSLIQFSELGFSEIFHLKDGFAGWVAAGHPTVD